MTKILVAASFGGHLEQLIQIIRPLKHDYDICYVTTTEVECDTFKIDGCFHLLPDFNRKKVSRLFKCFIKAVKIYREEKPDAIISTGAAPGMVMIIVGWLFRKKTVWIDSMANVHKISLSGRLIRPFASRTYTQWPHLAKGRIIYAGSVFGNLDNFER